jgi:hypothetical protein
MERFFTLKELGEVVHLSAETLRDRIKEGRLEAVCCRSFKNVGF